MNRLKLAYDIGLLIPLFVITAILMTMTLNAALKSHLTRNIADLIRGEKPKRKRTPPLELDVSVLLESIHSNFGKVTTMNINAYPFEPIDNDALTDERVPFVPVFFGTINEIPVDDDDLPDYPPFMSDEEYRSYLDRE